MKIIIDEASCYVQVGTGRLRREEGGTERVMDRPRLPVLACRLAYKDTSIPVRILLDTGNDITIVNPRIVEDLERELGVDLAILGRYHWWGDSQPVPAYPLAVVLGEGHIYNTEYGLIAPKNFVFDVADVWLGQELFSQLVVTFNGPEATVTIADLERRDE